MSGPGKSGWCIRLAGLIALLSCWVSVSSCGPPLLTSPEGTTTTHVSGSDARVYAPRAARAQKVIFDTPGRELIQAPDTPLRRFFDAHTADFADGKVGYAKTTILNDLVHQLRGRDYVKLAIQEVISRHAELAIAPAAPRREVLDDLRAAREKVQGAAARALLHELFPVSMPSVPQAPQKHIELVTDAAFAATSAVVGEAEALVRAKRLPGIPAELKAAQEAVLSPFARGGTVSRVLFRALEWAKDIEKKLRLGQERLISIPAAQHAQIRNNNIQLLSSTLSLALLRANYPDIRDEDVHELFDRLLQICDSTGPSCPNPDDHEVHEVWTLAVLSEAAWALELDLRRTLKEREFLRDAIERAVDKRVALFRSTVSPEKNLAQANTRLGQFVEQNLGDLLADTAGRGTDSLWKAFLAARNGGTERSLRQPGSTDPMSAATLAVFGTELRKATLEALKGDPDLKAALGKALEGRESYLQPEGKLGRVISDDGRKLLQRAAREDSAVQRAHSALAAAGTRFVAARKAAKDAEQQQKTAVEEEAKARSKLAPARAAAKSELETVRGPLEVLADETAAGLRQRLETDVLGQVTSITELLKDNAEVQAARANVESALTLLLDTLKKETRAGQAELGRREESLDNTDWLVGARAFVGDFPAAPSSPMVKDWKPRLETFVAQAREALGDGADEAVRKQIDTLVEVAHRAQVDLEVALADWKSSADKQNADTFRAPFKELLEKHEATLDAKALSEATTQEAAATRTELDQAHEQLTREILRAMKAARAELGPTDRFEENTLEPALRREVSELLRGVREKEGAEAQVPGLAVLTAALLADFRVQEDTRASRDRLVAAFQRTFEGFPELMGSEDPILLAVLKSGKITFGETDGAEGAPRAIHQKVQALWKSQKPEEKMATHLVEVIAQALADPAISYRFASPGASASVVSAFKEELFNAFKYRLDGSIAEEREAKYEYWWLTLHPKAVPTGDSRFDGDSHIQVSFPTTVIPEEQYRRWLIDHEDIIPGGAESATKLDRYWDRRIRTALDVISEFMRVLDTTSLADRYPRIRPVLAEAAERLNQAGATSPRLRFRSAMEYLRERARKERLRPYIAELQRHYDSERRDKVSVCETRAIDELFEDFELLQLTRNSVADEDGDSSFQSRDTLTELRNAVNPIVDSLSASNRGGSVSDSALLLLALAGSPVEEYVELVFRYAGSGANDLIAAEERARRDLSIQPFGLDQVLFAAISAGRSEAILPSKVELYANAYFDGSRRFSPDILDLSTNELSRILTPSIIRDMKKVSPEQFLVPITDFASEERIKLFLALSGVEAGSLNRLAMRLACLTEGCTPESTSSGDPRDLQGNPEAKTESPGEVEPEKTREAEAETLSRASLDRLKTRLTSLANRVGRPESSYDLLRAFSLLPSEDQESLVRWFFYKVRFRFGASHSEFIRYPQLWVWELELAQVREELRSILVNLFFSAYPEVPTRERLRNEFSKKDHRLEALAYQWLRELWLICERRGLFKELSKAHDLSKCGRQACESCRLRKGDRRSISVQANLYFKKFPFISDDARQFLVDHLSGASIEDSSGTPSSDTTPEVVGDIYRWMTGLQRNQSLMDQLSENLLDRLYEDLLEVCGTFGDTSQRPVSLSNLRRDSYFRFLLGSRPKVQPELQIVDMLPSSRDDLVARSISEGGVIAKIAGKAEAAASYSTDQLQSAYLSAQNLIRSLTEIDRGAKTIEDLNEDELRQEIERVLQSRQETRLLDEGSLGTEGTLAQQYLGAAARGSLFATAKAAMAYAKRREYLDAVITAAGRGDNFATWIVRKGDFRSDLAGTDAEENNAAAHTGYPNGDQPFHLLVKIPKDSIHTDWEGTRYILFNSSYVATERKPWSSVVGTIAYPGKALLYLGYPDSWEKLEQTPIGTVFPFKWDVHDEAEQAELFQDPNRLGGRIVLDDTDRIPLSRIETLLKAESAFISATRKAQSSTLDDALKSNEAASSQLQDEVQRLINEERARRREAVQNEIQAAKLQEIEKSLREEIDKLREELEALQEEVEEGAEDENGEEGGDDSSR